MFTELMPLLAERTVLITVARESDTTIRATVVPKRTTESENAALSTPLSFVGTPQELDRDFAKELGAYVDTHRQLGCTLAQAKATMEAAAKAAQEEAKRKADEAWSPWRPRGRVADPPLQEGARRGGRVRRATGRDPTFRLADLLGRILGWGSHLYCRRRLAANRVSAEVPNVG